MSQFLKHFPLVASLHFLIYFKFCVFVVVDIQDSMNMNVKVGACGNDGGDDEDDDEEGEAADMEGMLPKWFLKSNIWLIYETDAYNYTSLFRI